jgi:hypothetical protein
MAEAELWHMQLLADATSDDSLMGVLTILSGYSDAGINGDDTTGADFHMVEISYRF